MLGLHALEMVRQVLSGRRGERRIPVLVAFAGANEDLVTGEIEILHTQAATFHRHQPRCVAEAPQQSLHFFLRQHDRQSFRSLGSNDALNEADLLIENVMIQKQERVERLVLRRGTHMGCCSQTRQEPSHVRFVQIGDGPQVMKAHEALDPVADSSTGRVTHESVIGD